MKSLEEVYPQGEQVMNNFTWLKRAYFNTSIILFIDLSRVFSSLLFMLQADTSWAMTVLGYLSNLILGIIG